MLRYKLRFNCFFKRSTVHRFLLWVLNKDFFIIIYLFYFFRSIISTLDHYGGPLWVIKTLATPGKCPEFGAHMQSHCGYATAVLVTGPLPCRPVTSGRNRAALFFKALNAVLDGHPPCQGLRPVARVSHPRVGMPHRPKDTFSRSLWTSLQGVLCYAQQWPAQRRTPSSGSACHPSEPYFQPTAAVLSWWVLQCLTCCLCAEVRMRMTLRGPGGETEQGRDNNCLEHLQLSAYCDDSLCPYSCPQPANGSTCYSQSVWHFFVPELGWPHCASEEQILLQAAATPLLSAGLRSKALILAAVQWQVCFIQGCTAVMEGDASICGGEPEENSVVANVRVKRAGTRTQPCLMPLETGKGSDTNLFFPLCQPSFQQGETWWCWQVSVDSQAWAVMANRPSRLTVSKALVGSTKRMYRFWFCSLTFPGSLLLTAKIMSIVSLFLLKPPCWFSETTSSN